MYIYSIWLNEQQLIKCFHPIVLETKRKYSLYLFVLLSVCPQPSFGHVSTNHSLWFISTFTQLSILIFYSYYFFIIDCQDTSQVFYNTETGIFIHKAFIDSLFSCTCHVSSLKPPLFICPHCLERHPPLPLTYSHFSNCNLSLITFTLYIPWFLCIISQRAFKRSPLSIKLAILLSTLPVLNPPVACLVVPWMDSYSGS